MPDAGLLSVIDLVLHQAGFPHDADWQDLRQVGFIGLLRAIDTYRPDRGASLKRWANIRIRGAVLDYIRETTGWRYGRGPRFEPIQDRMLGGGPDELRPMERWIEARQCLALATPRERRILTARYLQDKSVVAIARAEGVTEGRISQIIGHALRQIRRRLAPITHDP